MENIILSVFLIVVGGVIAIASVRASDKGIKNSSSFKKYEKVPAELIKFIRIQNIGSGLALILTGAFNFYAALSNTNLGFILIAIYAVTIALTYIAKKKYI